MAARAWVMGAVLLAGVAAPAIARPTLSDILGYSFIDTLVSADHADRIAWVEEVNGVRNVWAAAGPGFAAHPVTHYTADDGQEITQLHFDHAADTIVFVRGGDHDANWPAEGDLAPDPASTATEDKVGIYAVPFAGGEPRLLAEGDEPDVSAKGIVAFVKEHQLWSVPLDGSAKPAKLLFDRGKDSQPLWSPDGGRLAFVSGRGDHSFITVYKDAATPLTYLAPSTGRDGDPVWSPDGTRIAFSRQPGDGGAPEPLLTRVPHPFAIWTADVATGEGKRAWASPVTLDGSYPQGGDGLGLRWMAGGTLAFLTTLDGWEHLYALPTDGGTPKLLTPGRFMVEHVSASRDRKTLYYAANTGAAKDDEDRRHAFRVGLSGGPVALSGGAGIETSPVAAGSGVALVSADATHPQAVALVDGKALKPLHVAVPAYPAAALVTPKLVSWAAPDGLSIQGQLFEPPGPKKKRPAVIFVHGGPPRQMLLGWHYMGYYSNAYALNQYLASRGFVVLSVNYRLSVGYGRAFEQPDHAGPAGGSEYQDVLAGARWLQQQPGVDPARIGIWGGSYGGYLTGMALSRNSDVFKAGSDLHGVHDWSRDVAEETQPAKRYEQGDWQQFLKVAFESSPDAQIAGWRSPVLLIQGDDDRNVRFDQTVDLAGRLTQAGVPFEELVLPNEIHGFLRHDSWLKADAATARFLTEKLGPME
ncbi:S9 family peptidase [Sphingomonas oryzagri]|uniref:Prolyl oligopeptidase family serine peptidase n=1 Tax=Sphingomonas oryzagri TaxID=3042314 RepID=A0ABT6N1S0_9SPHN|nr:prolyl oligopeptidase family serine peptidase [Sphingomonas oryzagri]MDH7638748.1 prolyl oligopeptidase family serine peptidase [Sphingomonas oryzagri]